MVIQAKINGIKAFAKNIPTKPKANFLISIHEKNVGKEKVRIQAIKFKIKYNNNNIIPKIIKTIWIIKTCFSKPPITKNITINGKKEIDDIDKFLIFFFYFLDYPK